MPVLTTIGRYSYCIYLIHPSLIMNADQHHLPQRLPTGRWHTPSIILFACIEFLIVFGVAALSYRFVERPILLLKRYAKYQRPTVNV